MYALVDCNNFFVSCERVFNPHLNHSPVVVLSNNDGCIVSRSNEAKALGIAMAAPYYQQKHVIRRHQVKVFSSNYALYGDMSSRVMQILGRMEPATEVYSIDEAFVKLPPNIAFKRRGLELYHSVLKETGLPVSVGIGATKTLAKLANYYAKKAGRPVVLLESEASATQALRLAPVEVIWGVGRKTTEKLRSFSIRTAWDFAHYNKDVIRKLFGVVGARIQTELQGIPCLFLTPMTDKKHIASTRSFGTLVTELPLLQEAISHYAAKAARKLRKQSSYAGGMYVYIRTNPFRKDLPQYRQSRLHHFYHPTCDSRIIIQAAKTAIASIYKEGYHYQKAGVILMDLSKEGKVQGDLFTKNTDNEALMKLLDSTQKRHGNKTIFLAAEGTKRPWHMRSVKSSPRYTSHWDELPVVH